MFAPNRTKEFFNSMAQPTKIHGRPTYLQIKKLEKELIQYATNITTDLGGGAHGYLGLVKTANEYNRITGTNFAIPVRPPDLQIAQGTTGHESFRVQQEHYRRMEDYREYLEVSKALGRMIQTAIDHEYLQEFIDTNTYRINRPIYEVLEVLYTRYGQVRRQDVKNKERDVENMNYDLSQPLTNVWKAIDDLQKLAKAAKMEYTGKQLTAMGLSVIKNTHDFERGIYDWEAKAEADKTYENLQSHFNNELEKLQQIRGDDMLQSTHHHVNAMRVDFSNLTNAMKEEVSDDIKMVTNTILAAIKEDKENVPPQMETVNAATSIDAMAKLVNAINGLENRIVKMEASCQYAPTGKGLDQNDPNYHIPFWMRSNNRFKYCWSCGSNATHDGTTCNRKKEGHEASATFQDRKGGSVNRIPKRFRNL